MRHSVVKITSVYLLACRAARVYFANACKLSRWLRGSSVAESAEDVALAVALICFTSAFSDGAVAICLKPHARCSKPLILVIILGAVSINQGRSELQNHCHELRARSLTQIILKDRPVVLRRWLQGIMCLRCSVPYLIDGVLRAALSPASKLFSGWQERISVCLILQVESSSSWSVRNYCQRFLSSCTARS